MRKKMCKNAEEIEQKEAPKYECEKCKSKAVKGKHLCKPKRIEKS